MAAAAHHRTDIDGLRGLAILSVVLYHASASLLPGGYVGVDIFFVISGYLITGIILKDLAEGHFSLRRFYARRIRRIYPALLTVLTTCLIAGAFILLPSEYASLGRHISASSVFISNFTLLKEAGYFDTLSDFKPLLHLWSLAVEEQFYLLWPLLLWGAWRMRRVALLLVLLVVCSHIFSLILTPLKAAESFYLPYSRFWELLVGGLLAYAEFKRPSLRLSPRIRTALSIGGCLLIGAAFLWFTKASAYPGWRAMLPVLGSIAILAAGMQSAFNRSFFGSAPMVQLGNISYPLYLWHWPLLAFVRILSGGEGSPELRAGAVGIAVVLAWLTTRYIERPIRFGSLRQSSRVIVFLFIALLMLGLAGRAVKNAHGLAQWRGLDSQRLEDLDDSYGYKKTKVPCGLEHIRSDWCVKSRDGVPDAVVYGDSHADHLFPGLADDSRRNWLLIGQPGCPPLKDVRVFNRTENHCIEKNDSALEAITHTASIRTVVLAALGPYYMSNESFSPEHHGKNEARYVTVESTRADETGLDKATLYYNGLDRTIRLLEKAGKNVVLVVDVPELDFMPERCLRRPVELLAEVPCGVERARVNARTSHYRAVIERLAKAHPNVRVFDSYPYMCDETMCYAGNADMLYYRDSHHLSLRGSRMLMGHLVTWLKSGGKQTHAPSTR